MRYRAMLVHKVYKDPLALRVIKEKLVLLAQPVQLDLLVPLARLA